MSVLRLNDRGANVSKLQERLRIAGFELMPTGSFDEATLKIVKEFQEKAQLSIDGLVGPGTQGALDKMLLKLTKEAPAFNKDIDDLFLNDGEYIQEIDPKTSIYIHHTAGGHRPDWTVKAWNGDNRGRVGTAFTIGGISKGGDAAFDGKTVRAFNEKHAAFHLGVKKNTLDPSKPISSRKLNRRSIGIEICNMGHLEKKSNGYFTYVGSSIPEDQVCDLGKDWKGHRYYHKYTDKQIAESKRLILTLAHIYHIPLRDISYDWDWFELKMDAFAGVPGLWTHVNVRSDKTDCFPQPELIEMLNGLHEAQKTFVPDLGGNSKSMFIPMAEDLEVPEGALKAYSMDMDEAEG
ncbi:MAG: peptidoglycan-binding protein [Bacteroidota bacterium]